MELGRPIANGIFREVTDVIKVVVDKTVVIADGWKGQIRSVCIVAVVVRIVIVDGRLALVRVVQLRMACLWAPCPCQLLIEVLLRGR